MGFGLRVSGWSLLVGACWLGRERRKRFGLEPAGCGGRDEFVAGFGLRVGACWLGRERRM